LPVVLGTVLGATLPLTGVALRTAIVWNKGSSSGGALTFVMGSFGLGSVLAPLAYPAMQGFTGSGTGDTSNATGTEMADDGSALSAVGLSALQLIWCLAGLVALLTVFFGCLVPAPLRPETATDTTTDTTNTDTAVDVTTDDATDACFSSEGATPGSVRASIHRGEADAAADPELATAVRGCQHGDASSSWMVRARGLLHTSCREWRVLAPLTVFLGMSVAAENTVGGWIYTMASHGEADLSSAVHRRRSTRRCGRASQPH
jgi:hypothetical protein